MKVAEKVQPCRKLLAIAACKGISMMMQKPALPVQPASLGVSWAF